MLSAMDWNDCPRSIGIPVGPLQVGERGGGDRAGARLISLGSPCGPAPLRSAHSPQAGSHRTDHGLFGPMNFTPAPPQKGAAGSSRARHADASARRSIAADVPCRCARSNAGGSIGREALDCRNGGRAAPATRRIVACPVKTLRVWLEASDVTFGPLFGPITGRPFRRFDA